MRAPVAALFVGTMALLPVRVSSLEPVGTEFLVNTFTVGTQGGARVASADSGDFVVAWMGSPSSPFGFGYYAHVYGRRFSSAGTALAAEFQISTSTALVYPRGLALASDPGGSFVVAWAHGSVFSVADVIARRFDSDGAELGTEFQVNVVTGAYQGRPAVATEADGDFIVAWTRATGPPPGAADVYARRFDNAANAVGSEFLVNSFTEGIQAHAAVTIDPFGQLVFVWIGHDGSMLDVFGRRFSSDGNPLGSEFQVNTHTTGAQVDPVLAADDAGFLVVWASDRDGSGYGVFGQRFDSSGLPQGTEFQINSYTVLDQSRPAVTEDTEGNFVVVWQSFHDGSGAGMFGRRIGLEGPVGQEFQVNTATALDQGYGDVTSLGDGKFVVAWTGQSSLFTNEIFGQRFRTTCAALPSIGCTSPGKSTLLIKDAPPTGPSQGDRLAWKWLRGPETVQADFGDPLNTTSYTLCVYHADPTELFMEVDVPAVGTCGGQDCWRTIGTKGYKYRDRGEANDGVAKLILKGGDADKAKIVIKGRNIDLPTPLVGIDDTNDVTVQLHNTDNANCWEAVFTPDDVRRAGGGKYKATIP